MIYICYVTKDKYSKILETYLLPTLKKWNLTYDIEYIEDRGSWIDNVCYRPEFIKKMLLKHQQAVVSLDSDATIEQYPELLDKLENYDIAYHELNWNKFWQNQTLINPKKELLAGTLYFNYNERVLSFVDTWIERQNLLRGREQRNMQNLLEEGWKEKLKIYYLPVEYVAMIRRDDKIPNFIKEPIIVHYLASQTFHNWKEKCL